MSRQRGVVIIYCNLCGAEIPDEEIRCRSCGAVMPLPDEYYPPDEPYQQPPGETGYQGEQQYFSPGDAYQQIPQYGHQPSYQREAAPVSKFEVTKDTTTMAFSIATGVSGLVVFFSTFLPWIKFWIFSSTGWYVVLHAGESGNGNFLYVSGEGALFFTGFWSLLIGLAVIAGGVMLLLEYPVGGRIAQLSGALGALLCLISMITMYTHNGSAGIGLWLFLLFSIASGIVGELAIKSYE